MKKITQSQTYQAGNEFGGANKISAVDIEAGYATKRVIRLKPAIGNVQTPVSGSAAIRSEALEKLEQALGEEEVLEGK